ncbi:MAG: hypothetical protein ACR2QF_17090 [Geminicoccaceae bacterium]
MADPIVVSQLIKKRSELAGLVDAKRSELSALLKDLTHIDAVIRLFDPDKAPELLPVKQYRPKDKYFARNELMRRTLEILRLADKPMRAREIAVQIAADKGLETDTRSMKLLTKRVVDALKRQERLLGNRLEGTAKVWWI